MSTNRTKQIARALAEAIGSMLETAAEQLDMDARLAKIEIRMETFGAALECIGAQKDAIVKRMLTASPTLQAMYQSQLHMLTLQEVSVLERAGVETPLAQQAVAMIDHQPIVEAPEQTPGPDAVRIPAHNRRKPQRNGVPVTNGHGEG